MTPHSKIVSDTIGCNCAGYICNRIQANNGDGVELTTIARYYANEKEVGEAVKDSGVPREDVFITSKILNPEDSAEATYKSVIGSVTNVDGSDGYLDLMLIHNAVPHTKDGRKMMWQAMEKAKNEGKLRDIGVSNFGIGHLEEMKSYAEVWPPVVNQIELHPWCQQRDVVEFCQKNKIVIEAYCPIARNQKADDPTLVSIAKKHSKSSTQVLLRYALQKQWVPLPKSDNAGRIGQNADLYDFSLDGEDMKKLDGLDEGEKGALVMAVSNS